MIRALRATKPAASTRVSLLLMMGLAAAAAAGCAEDFDPYNRLTGLRVLAIQTSPVAPAPGETVTITPLVYAPAGQTLTFAWSWCPLPGAADDGYPCQVTEAGLAAMAGPTVQIPPFDLGTGATAQFTHTIDPAVLRALCRVDEAGQPLPPAADPLANLPFRLDCSDGFPAQIKMQVQSQAGGAVTDTVVAVRTFNLRLEATTPPNTNPNIAGVFATVNGNELPLTDAAAVPLLRLRNNDLRAVVAPENAEAFIGQDAMGQPMATRERLFLTWFVETGDTDEERTSWIPDQLPLENLLENEWRPKSVEDYPAPTARLILVLRDSRQGVSWLDVGASLVVAP